MRTDHVVCPDCNIEDAMLSNMIGEIAEILRVRSVFWFRTCLGFRTWGFRVLGFRVHIFGFRIRRLRNTKTLALRRYLSMLKTQLSLAGLTGNHR